MINNEFYEEPPTGIGGKIERQSGDKGPFQHYKMIEFIKENPWSTAFFSLLGIAGIFMVIALILL